VTSEGKIRNPEHGIELASTTTELLPSAKQHAVQTYVEIRAMTILLVDNDTVYVNLMAEVLRLHSFNCALAPDGEAALAMLRKQPYDLVISDISMPRMNGMNLYKHIRSDATLKNTLFAWNSGYRELRDIVEVENPSIDFKLDKAMPMPSFLYFINSLQERLQQSRSAVLN
jgi:DNA-binding response OmpR family regulator